MIQTMTFLKEFGPLEALCHADDGIQRLSGYAGNLTGRQNEAVGSSVRKLDRVTVPR